MLNYSKINKILTWLIILALIVFLIFFNIYKTDPCHNCSFEINGNSLNIKQFFDLFSSKCLVLENVDKLGDLSVEKG